MAIDGQYGEQPLPGADSVGIFAVAQMPERAKGTALLAHGINVDHTEDRGPHKAGLFDYVVEHLHGAGVASVRWDFRGHGRSAPISEGVSIASELEDLRSIAALTREAEFPPISSFVGCSFGACATVVAVSEGLSNDLGSVVLLNPVLDPYGTFFDPATAWARQTVGPTAIDRLRSGNTVMLDGEFPLTRAFLNSSREYSVMELARSIRVPTLIVHGTADTYVEHLLSRELALDLPVSSFIGVVGSEHGFGDVRDRVFVAKVVASFVERYVRH